MNPLLRSAILILFIVKFDIILAQDDGGCPPPCCGGGSFDRASVTLVGMEPRQPIGGWIEIIVDQFSTFEDGCDAPIEFAMKRGCWTEIAGLLHGSDKSAACMVICGSPPLCPEQIACTDCPGLFTHSCGYFTVRHPLWGKGTFQVFHKGNLIFSQDFDYSDPSVPGLMRFTDIRFLNKDYTQIHYNDIFDGLESVALEVTAEFTGERPQQGVGVVLKSNLSADSILISLPLLTWADNIALYSGILHEGTFIPLLGDRELPPYVEGEIIARPVAENCDGTPNRDIPEARISVANFVLWVKQISFASDYQLCKDGPASQPENFELIEDPVWVKDAKNEPVAYRRNTRPDMNIVVQCNRTPYHDFQYWLKGGAAENQRNYSTAIYEGSFNSSSLDTVFSVTFENRNFPDSVGIIDPLEYWWYANKAINYDPMYYIFLNRSAHKIFLTYEAPLFSPVNILGLDKICHYAQNLNVERAIAEAGVNGVYREGWNYNPDKPTVFIYPLDVIRQRIGLCADYANLLTYLYLAIGIQANSVTIYNGTNYQGTDYWLFWRYTYLGGAYICLLSKELRSCDGQTMIWPFRYHATSYAAGSLCDAALGIIDTKANYTKWWKYYLQPAEINPPPGGYLHTEPPTMEPTYIDWPDYVPAQIMPPNITQKRIDFYHP